MPTYSLAVLAGVVVALVQIVKQTELVPNRFLPVVSVVLGGVLGYIAGLDIISSLMVGAAGSGLYDLGKKSILDK